jgi:hypothetical protein
MYGHGHCHIDLLTELVSQAVFSVQNCIIPGGWCTLIADIFYFCKYVLHKLAGRIHNSSRPDQIKNFKQKKIDLQTYSFKQRDSIN